MNNRIGTARIQATLAVAGLLIMGVASAYCVYPKAPASIPDGATATEKEMASGTKAVREYNANVNAYLGCLEVEMNTRVAAAGADTPADQIAQIRAIHTKRHNAAVEELEAHAAQFNEQVKTYKSRDKKAD